MMYLRTWALYTALLVAWIATLGSLYFSEVRHFVPCTFCWYQRILMYPLVLLIGIGLLRQDRHLPYLILPFSIIGQGVSTYHYLLQKTTIFGAPTTCSAGVPCSAVYINWLGFITIPFLAMLAFMLITLCGVVAIYRGELDEPVEKVAWLPVVGIIAITGLSYGILAWTASATSPVAVAKTIDLTPIAQNTAAFSPVEPTPTNAAFSRGAAIYAEACAGCHGDDGRGVANLGTSLADSELIRQGTPEDVLTMIRAGRAADDPHNQSGLTMPASGGRPDLSDAEILAVIDYLQRSLDTH